MNRHTLHFAITVLVMLAAAVVPAPAQVTPPPPIVVNSPVITINNSPGDQTDPHVDKDFTAYTDTIVGQIRYYQFSTGVDAAIPGSDTVIDILSDVNGGRVAFSRIESDRNAIMVFDTATASLTEIDPQVGSNRLGDALGGNTLAWVDLSTGLGDIYAYDLSASPPAPPQLVSGDPSAEGNPNVSPDGNIIVWERCITSLTNCDILKGVRSGGTWTVSAVADTPDPEGNPDTDGKWITYDASYNGNQHIHFQPAAGGPDVELDVPGWQVNPSISKGFIGFESRATENTPADLFVYDIANNILYQVTSTANINENLNDISVLDNGDIRMVWAANDGALGDQDIHATTFTPITPVQPMSVLNSSVVVTEFRRLHNSDLLAAGATVQLSPSGGFNQATDSLGVVVAGGTATVSITIPLAQFTKFGNSLIFSGVLNGIPTDAAVVPLGGNKYAIAAAVGKQSLAGFANPATVSITLGNNAGTATTNAQILKF